MPRYDYECEVCQHQFELKQRFDSDPIATCPRCEGDSHRRFHVVPVVFKGSGWYVNDYGKRGTAMATAADSKEAAESGDKAEGKAKAESKPEAKAEGKAESKAESVTKSESKAGTKSEPKAKPGSKVGTASANPKDD